ncbi:hypothetical protein HOO65_010340 [Ceratocystis lukuohia]|uniref:Uncharacterized protein n=1 Tax=Ceratocystis lukuohia TaxID=2019550 RepID=A0ABR4MRT1_9PEZI
MSARKDQRRIDLIVPYQEPAPKDNESVDLSSSLSSTMPMAAMMTRNRYFGCAGSIRWISRVDANMKTCLLVMALVVTYLPMFMPPPIARGTNTEAPAPVAPVL